MVALKYGENLVYQAVLDGELEIDELGQIWRVKRRRWNRWTKTVETLPCERKRAENATGGDYLQIRAMFDSQRIYALAHRLVYRHFFGPIPEGKAINHKNGSKADNRPSNLEPSTYSENTIHSMQVLKHGRLSQKGSANVMAKLTPEKAATIRSRRAAGESLKAIAADFGVSDKTVSKIALGQRWV